MSYITHRQISEARFDVSVPVGRRGTCRCVNIGASCPFLVDVVMCSANTPKLETGLNETLLFSDPKNRGNQL
jgi:hypothetical protein